MEVVGLGTLSPEDFGRASTERNGYSWRGWGEKHQLCPVLQRPLAKGAKERNGKKDKLELYEIAETRTELGEVLCASLTSTLETARSETGIAFIY